MHVHHVHMSRCDLFRAVGFSNADVSLPNLSSHIYIYTCMCVNHGGNAPSKLCYAVHVPSVHVVHYGALWWRQDCCCCCCCFRVGVRTVSAETETLQKTQHPAPKRLLSNGPPSRLSIATVFNALLSRLEVICITHDPAPDEHLLVVVV